MYNTSQQPEANIFLFFSLPIAKQDLACYVKAFVTFDMVASDLSSRSETLGRKGWVRSTHAKANRPQPT